MKLDELLSTLSKLRQDAIAMDQQIFQLTQMIDQIIDETLDIRDEYLHKFTNKALNEVR